MTVMEKASLLLLAGLIPSISCQRADMSMVSVAEVVDRLQEGAGKPYGCIAHRSALVSFDNPPELGTFAMEIKFFQLSEWVSCSLIEVSLFDHLMPTYFEKTMNGLRHSIKEPYSGDYAEWICDSWNEGSSPSNGLFLFPEGGWDLCSQASGLIQAYSPSEMSVVGDSLVMKWNPVPKELSEELIRHNPYRGWEKDSVAESFYLEIDYERGVPVAMGLLLKDGKSFEVTYSDFEFLEDDYSARLQSLREGIDIPVELGCWCDGPIYDVTLHLPVFEDQ